MQDLTTNEEFIKFTAFLVKFSLNFVVYVPFLTIIVRLYNAFHHNRITLNFLPIKVPFNIFYDLK